MRKLLFLLGSILLAAPVTAAENKLEIKYYEKPLTLVFDDEIAAIKVGRFNDESPREFYNQLRQSDHESFHSSLLKHKQQLRLNDWLYYILVQQAVGQVFNKYNSHYRNLATWFFLTQSGYRAKMLYNTNKAYIFVHTQDMVLEMPYIETSEGRFINISSHFDKSALNLGKLYDAGVAYNAKAKSFSFKLEKLPSFLDEDVDSRVLRFPHDDKVYTLKIKADRSIIKLLRNYPKLELDALAAIPLTEAAYTSIIPAFKDHLEDMSADEAVRFILSFTRQAFAYKTDQEAYNEQNVAFPSELTLYAPYSDCEDRAVLFAYLVKELLGLETILLEYPSHVSAAVNLPNPHGKPIIHEGKAYTFAEPTGPQNHLALGELPPKYKKLTFKVLASGRP